MSNAYMYLHCILRFRCQAGTNIVGLMLFHFSIIWMHPLKLSNKWIGRTHHYCPRSPQGFCRATKLLVCDQTSCRGSRSGSFRTRGSTSLPLVSNHKSPLSGRFRGRVLRESQDARVFNLLSEPEARDKLHEVTIYTVDICWSWWGAIRSGKCMSCTLL